MGDISEWSGGAKCHLLCSACADAISHCKPYWEISSGVYFQGSDSDFYYHIMVKLICFVYNGRGDRKIGKCQPPYVCVIRSSFPAFRAKMCAAQIIYISGGDHLDIFVGA